MVVLALTALAGGLAGCVDSEPEAAQTPSGAETIMNTAVQTDEMGSTISPTTDAGSTPGSDTGGGETTAGSGGDVAAGQSFFEGTCQSCHANLGQQAAVGPQLAGQGLDEQTIRTTVENGRGAMPGGLAQGEDLDNVVAFVLSIQ